MIQIYTLNFFDIILLPLLLLLLSVLKLSRATGYVNFQINVRSVMLLFLIAGCVVFFISPKKSAYHLTLLIVPLSYFIAEYFVNFRKNFFKNLTFYIFFFITVILGYSYNSSTLVSNRLINTNDLFAAEVNEELNGKLLVLGDDIDYYLNNEIATGYLNWQVAKQRFENLRDVKDLLDVKSNFERELPDIIIDQENVIPVVFEFLPELAARYKEVREGVYKRDEALSKSLK